MSAAAFTLLFYVCAAPVAPSARMSCVAQQLTAETCTAGVAMAEAGLTPSRFWFAAACIATPEPLPEPTGRAPRRPATSR